MSMYINGTGILSAQHTFDKSVLQNGFNVLKGNRLPCVEPDYGQFIDAKQIRRMSRIIRMGIVSSLLATKEAGVEKPDAIIVGTAFGCLEDTYAFLSKLVQYKEDMLSPTAFIHSTHNTIAAQVALLFQSRGYNSTYVHRALSFESALLDAMLLLEEGATGNILVGGIDEITEAGFTIMNRLGFFKEASESAENDFYNHAAKGSAAGEGAAFFSLGPNKTSTSYAKIIAVDACSNISVAEAVQRANELLSSEGILQPDLLVTGHNGDPENDRANDIFAEGLHCTEKVMKYKHLCGEYATSSAFGLWLGAELLKQKFVPECFHNLVNPAADLNNILLYNQQDGKHHSFILIQPC